MDLVEAMFQATATLTDAGVAHALCGGIAVTIHGATRSTKDIDLLVAAEDIERAVDALRDAGWRFRAYPMTFDAGTATARTVHRVSRVVDSRVYTIDLLEVGDAFRAAFDGREPISFGDRSLTVVSREGLMALKRMAGRAQDLADLEKLGLADD